MTTSQSPYAHLFKETKTFETMDKLSIRYTVLKTEAEKTRGSVLLLSGWTEFMEKSVHRK